MEDPSNLAPDLSNRCLPRTVIVKKIQKIQCTSAYVHFVFIIHCTNQGTIKRRKGQE